MFGVFHRKEEQVRAPAATAPAVPTATYDRLAAFVRSHDRRIQLTPEDKAALLRLAANPPAWTNRLPTSEEPLAFPSTMGIPFPFGVSPADGRAVPPSAAGHERATGGPAW
jgi:hypothetical protein